MLKLSQDAKVVRSGKNAHSYICFINGKIRSFATRIEDINSQVAELFGHLNATRFVGAGVLTAMLMTGMPLSSFALDANTLPTGGTGVAGNPNISQNGNHMTVSQPGSKSIINWNSYSIGKDASVLYTGPRGFSSLNRVLGGSPSEILGSLRANNGGKIFLINPAGIFVGNGANVNVGGLVASTLDIRNHDFLNGNYVFNKVDGFNGSIKIDQGAFIQVDKGGSASLLSNATVNNAGNIYAPGGAVQIAVGERISLGDDLIGVTVDKGLQTAINDAAIVNSGSISAAQVKMIASVVQDNVRNVMVNNTGRISANKVVDGEGGTIELIADNGVVENAGVVDASGVTGGRIVLHGSEGSTNKGQLIATASEGKGGAVDVLGEEVTLADNSSIDASGETGGGKVRIGGDFKGENPDVPNSANVYFAKNASVKADAGATGNGGDVAVWADDTTEFHGKISAKGGSLSGNGGEVETSGKELLTVGETGSVDASAANGESGNWLLDPRNVTIGVIGSNLNSGQHNPTTNNSMVSVFSVNNALNNGTNVLIHTGSTGAQDGNITVAAGITKLAGGDATLSLHAANDLNVNAPITSLSGKLNVNLRADSDLYGAPQSNGAGTLNLNSPITTNGGNVFGTGAKVNNNTVVNAGTGTIDLQSKAGDLVTKGGLIGGTVNLTAENGSVVQTAGAILADTANLKSTGGDIRLNGGSLTAGTSTLRTTGGHIVQSGGSILGGTTSLIANGDITLASTVATTGDINATTNGGTITFKDNSVTTLGDINATANNGGITVTRSIMGADDINLTSNGGDINRNGGLMVSDTATWTANGGDVHQTAGVTTANTITLKAAGGDVMLDAGQFNGGTQSYTSGGGDVRTGANMNGTNVTLAATGGNVVQTGGNIAATNINVSTDVGNINQLGGIMNATGTLTLSTIRGNILQDNATMRATTANLTTNTGDIVLRNSLLNANTVNILAKDAGDVSVDTGGTVTGTNISVTSENGYIGVNGLIDGSNSVRLTTQRADVLTPASIKIGAKGGVRSFGGSVYINTDGLYLDGSIDGQLVQIWPWHLTTGMEVGGGTSFSRLSITQAMMDRINQHPALSGVNNNIMLGHQNYTGTIELGTLDMTAHPTTDLYFNAPRVFESTPTTDTAGVFNLYMAPDRSVFFTAGAATPADWGTAPGGVSFGDNTVFDADLDVSVTGTGGIGVKLLGSATPLIQYTHQYTNGAGNKGYINVVPPVVTAAGGDDTTLFPDTGVVSFRNLGTTLDPAAATQITNEIKGSVIDLPGNPVNNIPTNFNGQPPTPFITNQSL